MRFRTTTSRRFSGGQSLEAGGFTLAEVLAALLFMAIVIPVAVGALRVSARGAESAIRKDAATRIAEQVLDEAVITSGNLSGAQRGSVTDNQVEYRWDVKSENWQVSQLRLLSVRVAYNVQGASQQIELSTVAETSRR